MKLAFFGGKGGVGKTTCAAAAALRAADEGARVLLVSTDPAHSLGDALGRVLGPEPVKVGPLMAAELDADRALARWLRDRESGIRTVIERGTYFDREDIDRFLALAFPGVDELVGLVELARLARERPYDRVVVDTAPTGHMLRLLAMPDTLARLGEILDGMHEKHRFLASSLGGRYRADFADEVIAEIAEEAEGLRRLLAGDTTFTWVTLPEELPMRETADGIAALEALGIRADPVVVNRVWPAPDRACALCSPRVAAEARWREEARLRFADRIVLEVPATTAEPTGLAALRALAATVRHAVPAPATKAPPRDAPAGPMTPLPLPDTLRLVLFGGKGGVGKTTASAAEAIALATARPEARVLVLSTDPAHSLGDALGVPLGDDPRPVPGGPPNLVARELDATVGWKEQQARYRASLDELFGALFGNLDISFDRAVLEDLLDLAPPGIDEVLALVTILDALDGDAHDLVVVDTAPTGHTLRLLALPERVLEWVHALMSVLLKYRSVIGLGELAADLTSLARRLRGLVALLADPGRAAFVIVTRAAALPRLESERLAEALAMPVAAVLVNAVTEPACARCVAATREEASARAAQARLGPPTFVAPAMFPAPRGVAALRRYRKSWRRERAGRG